MSLCLPVNHTAILKADNFFESYYTLNFKFKDDIN